MAGKPLPEGVIRKACEQECANLMVKSWQRFVGRAWTQLALHDHEADSD